MSERLECPHIVLTGSYNVLGTS